MKPDPNGKDEEAENAAPISGDAIGDTAYSERFVLKILLKLANLDTLKEEIKEKSFEEDLCTLWDMTAERDVVTFLLKHDILNLFNFTLPAIESPRIVEIIVGIIGNMCCHKDVVIGLLKMESFMSFLLEYIKSDDSLVLVQLLRLINSCLFLADDYDVLKPWMNLFINTGYSTALYFMLQNSSNKELLVTALENLNTICSYCNVEKTRTNFFTHFVTLEALESLCVAFTEVTINKREVFQPESLERILVITLQIVLNLLGFDKSLEIYGNSKDSVINMIQVILTYYENKLVTQKEIDSDLYDIIESTSAIVKILDVSKTCNIDKYFVQSYSMWKALSLIMKSDKNGQNFEEDDKEELDGFSKEMKTPLSTLMSIYMANCSDDNLLKVLDEIGTNYDDIVKFLKDLELKMVVSKRTENYRTRLKESVES